MYNMKFVVAPSVHGRRAATAHGQTFSPLLAGACAQYCGRSIPRRLLVCGEPRWESRESLPRSAAAPTAAACNAPFGMGRHTINIVLMLCACTSGDHIGATLMHKLAAFAAVGPDALSAPLLPALVHTQAGSAPTPASPGCTDCEHAGQTDVSQMHVWVIVQDICGLVAGAQVQGPSGRRAAGAVHLV